MLSLSERKSKKNVQDDAVSYILSSIVNHVSIVMDIYEGLLKIELKQ